MYLCLFVCLLLFFVFCCCWVFFSLFFFFVCFCFFFVFFVVVFVLFFCCFLFCFVCVCVCAAQLKKSEKASCLFQSLEFFVSQLALGGLGETLQFFEGPSQPPVLSPRDEETYTKAKREVVWYIVRLVGVLVDHHYDNLTSVSSIQFHNTNTHEAIIIIIMIINNNKL